MRPTHGISLAPKSETVFFLNGYILQIGSICYLAAELL